MQTATASTRGEVITFYSYKGGTGRTMALANVACLLADRVRPAGQVLVVDWDLEAPGLHRFFPPPLRTKSGLDDLGLDATPGLIDLFTEIAEKLPAEEASDEEIAEKAVEQAIASITLDRYISPTREPGVYILRAGRNDDGQYSRRANTFSWEGLFRRGPSVYRALVERLADRFAYVLVDSRTGETDISGICTTMIPNKLVVVFTPNRQSITGVRDLVSRATAARRRSDDFRPLLVFPLPSRIEASMRDLRSTWRFGDRDRDIAGYQPTFEHAFADCYGLGACDLGSYFDVVQLQQTPDYAYGEEIAVRSKQDRFSLGESYRIFVGRLTSQTPPWAAPKIATAPAQAPVSSPAGSSVSAEDKSMARIFLSYAPQDRDRVQEIAETLASSGFEVWPRQQPSLGADWQRQTTEALDRSRVVVVFWSRASVSSESVLAEAEEGLRRGVLVPVLLDDAPVPLTFRGIQSADLRRDPALGMARLMKGVSLVAESAPGTAAILTTAPQPASRVTESAAPPRIGLSLAKTFALLFVVAVAAAAMLFTRAKAPSSPQPDLVDAGVAVSQTVRVPDFTGSALDIARGAALALGLDVVPVATDGGAPDLDGGLVVTQEPAVGQLIARGSRVTLSVANAAPKPPLPDASHSAKLARAVATMIETGTVDQNVFLQWMTTVPPTLRITGSTYQILHRYVLQSGPRTSEVQPYLDRAEKAEKGDPNLATDKSLKALLAELARDPLIIQLAKKYLDEGWWDQAVKLAADLGLKTPLGLSVIYDARVKAPTDEAAQIASVNRVFDGGTPASGADEHRWVTAFVKTTKEPSRSEYQNLIKDDNWNLTKPILIRGQPLVLDWGTPAP